MVISWFEYYLLINQLIAVLESKKLGFNQVIGLTRGGFRPAEQVARAFKVNLALLGVESYEGETQKDVTLSRGLLKTSPGLGQKILLIDDLTENGTSLEMATEWVYQHCKVVNLWKAVLWHKALSRFEPDIWIHSVPEYPAGYKPPDPDKKLPWIIQPFEQMDIEEFRKPIRAGHNMHFQLVPIAA